MADTPVPRGYLGALLDRLVGWKNGLPPETCSYTVTPVKIPLEGEEDVQLLADLFQPVTTDNGPAAGTVLVQSPYGRGFPLNLNARVLPPRGYNVLYVSSRGTFGSGGKLDPARTDAADGVRVVSWMRKQPWYTGTFGTIGASFLGYSQWALMGSDEPPDDMVAAVPLVGPHDFSELIWGTGAFWMASIDWAHNTTQTSRHPIRRYYNMITANPLGLIGIKKSVPLVEGAKAVLGDKTPWLYEWLTRPDWEHDDFYKPMKQDKALDTTDVAILLQGGWQDVFTNDVIAQFQRLNKRGSTVAMTVGPWDHLGSGRGEGVLKETLEWLDKYLAKRKTGDIRPAPIRFNVTGANEWRWIPSWPPATKPLELHLGSQGRLSGEQSEKTDESAFRFDPQDPTPTIGGNLLFAGGTVDDTALARRPDVLSFTTAPLDHDVEVLGKPRVELTHSSDNPHVDVLVRLSEVSAKGVSHNITEVYRRLDPDRAPSGHPVRVELLLTDCAHRFRKGTAIRLYVAGGNFPHYSYNLGSGENQGTGTTLKPATHTVHSGGISGSKVVLPVSLD